MQRITRWPVPAVLALWIIGCGGQRDATRDSTADPAVALSAFEADFNPSDLDPDPTATRSTRPDSASDPSGQNPYVSPAPTETVQGFRVQVFSTANIDEANARKTALEEAIPHERVYLEFDPPAYKIRAGNFLTRHDADRFVRFLSDKGITGAWAVPQRVLKNPPPPPPRPTEPQAP